MVDSTKNLQGWMKFNLSDGVSVPNMDFKVGRVIVGVDGNFKEPLLKIKVAESHDTNVKYLNNFDVKLLQELL